MTDAHQAAAPPATAPGVVAPWQPLMLVVVCLVLFLPGFFSVPPFDRDEARFAQASRQMLETGDLIDIRFQDEARHKKPAGIYWLQAASASVFGGAADAPIWAYRIPSLLGAIAAVLLTFWAGCLLFTPSIAWLGTLMLAGCVVLGVEARMAKTDAVLLATVVAAQGALAALYLAGQRAAAVPRPGWGLPLVFWVATGLGVLIKGPVGPMVSALTITALAAADRRIAWIKTLRPLSGIAIVLAIAAPWLIAITIETEGRFFAESIGHDMLGKVASGQESKGLPPGYYLGTFWVTFAPFAFLALLALPWVWRQRRDPTVRFCLAWIIPTWLVFELVATKLLHYTLPTFPAIALLAAAALVARDEAGCQRRPWLLGLGAVLQGIVFIGLAIGVSVGAILLGGNANLIGLALALGAGALFATAIAAAWRFQTTKTIRWTLASAVAVYALAFQVVLPGVDPLWVSRSAAQAVTEHQPCPNPQVASVGYAEPSLVFLLGTDVQLLGSGGAAADHLVRDPACAIALVEARHVEAFRAGLDGHAVAEVAVVEGFNYSRGREVRIGLYRVAQ